jgi:hypothetical protein
MFKPIADWLLNKGLIFGTLLINLITAGFTILLYLIVGIIVSWMDRHL